MTTGDAKTYLAGREIPQLFESLLTGLMYYRPEDHINFLETCLKSVKKDGVETFRWNLFLEQRRKTPLPPIAGNNKKNKSREPSFIKEGSVVGVGAVPLPPISAAAEQLASSFTAPPCPLVFVMGGPGSGKATQCERLVARYAGWVHLSMGDLLRANIVNKGSAGDKWDMIGTLVQEGEMAPEEVTCELLTAQLSKHPKAAGIIIEGYPRTMQQAQDYERVVKRVDLAFVLDCEEVRLQQRLLSRGAATGRIDDNINAVAARVSTFKNNSLAVIKHFDDQGKVVVIDGDRDTDEIFFELSMLFDSVFFTAPEKPGETAAS